MFSVVFGCRVPPSSWNYWLAKFRSLILKTKNSEQCSWCPRCFRKNTTGPIPALSCARSSHCTDDSCCPSHQIVRANRFSYLFYLQQRRVSCNFASGHLKHNRSCLFSAKDSQLGFEVFQGPMLKQSSSFIGIKRAPINTVADINAKFSCAHSVLMGVACLVWSNANLVCEMKPLGRKSRFKKSPKSSPSNKSTMNFPNSKLIPIFKFNKKNLSNCIQKKVYSYEIFAT